VPAAPEYSVFDADNHYYEALDAFTRHLDPRVQPRTVQWCDIGGRQYHLVGGRLSHAVTNPTFNPIAKPGALHQYLKGQAPGSSALELLRDREPIPDYYLQPEARLKKMDEQGVDRVWLFPTLGVLYEELLKHDIEAVKLTFHAFNRWLDEDWGLAFRNRIFGSAYISLADVDFAVSELEWALERGARSVVMRPSAVHTVHGPLSPGDPRFDPFWARVNEAGISVVVHAGDSGYSCNGYAPDGFGANFGSDGVMRRPSVKAWSIEFAARDFLAQLIFDRVFERFPAVRVASIENGSDFLGDLFRKLGSLGRKMPGYFQSDPVETFRRHIWVNPFWEDSVDEVVGYMGADRVIFGSDWPHIEGLPNPLDYLDELGNHDAASQQRIMSDNMNELNELRPA
jgi:predicted TIM-barrel fold metal-dependent hydrolase